MIEMIKELYIFALLLLVFSYLVPREEYKSYMQFFIGIFLIVVILKPVLQFVVNSDTGVLYGIFEGFNEELEGMEEVNQWEAGTEGDIYELFIFEGKGE